ncbi:MAG TPA: DUF3147 family protein [Candidatus Limnocylindrales bacterium]|jgi:hypothetical protein|nr:DUF3147 family protein [Candidatus Limnocylindrales bacterium]
MTDLLARFLLGGVIVSLFAAAGDLFKPKSFAGLFGAAPSVALATLVLTVAKHGHEYAAVEGRSMIIGAAAFLIYAQLASWSMMRHSISAMRTTLMLLPVWLVIALGGWWVILGRPK